MSVNSFKSTIWEARLLENYKKASVAERVTTKPVRLEGEKAVFNRIGASKVKDYEGTVSWDAAETSPVELAFDQKKYFAVTVDDVDAVQASGDVLDQYMTEEAEAFAESADAYVMGLYTEAHEDNKVGDDTTPIEVTAANAYDTIVNLGVKLSKQKAPMAGRYVMVNAEVLGLLEKDPRFTATPEYRDNGIVEGQKINGMQVVVTEEVHQVGDNHKIMAVARGGVGYGKQIDKMEAMRLENSFADGVRGLAVYGATALNPKGIAVATVKL